jgi:hypothetical protein
MTRLKEVRETRIVKREDYIHIETDGCIVNIRPGLFRDAMTAEDKISMTPRSEKITVIEVIPDGRCDENPSLEWVREGDHATRCVRREVKR